MNSRTFLLGLAFSTMAALPLFATPAEDMLAKADKTADGLVAMANGAKNTPPAKEGAKATLDPVAWEALLLSYEGAETNPKDFHRFKYGIPTAKAIATLRKTYLFPKVPGMAERLLAHKSPEVRAAMVERMSAFLFGTSEESRKMAVDLLAKEESPIVLAALVRTFANDGGKVPEIGAFLVRQLDSKDPAVRRAVVCFAPSSWNFETPGLAEKMAAMFATEKDPDVRLALGGYACKLGKEVLVAPYVALLSDPDAKLRAKALEGLVKMWWAFPLFNTSSEGAYRASLEALGKTTPSKANHAAVAPAFKALSWKIGNPKIKEKWLKAAPWYVPADVRKVLEPWFRCAKLTAYQRTTLLKALYAHGNTKEELKAMIDDETFGLAPADKPRMEKALQSPK